MLWPQKEREAESSIFASVYESMESWADAMSA